MEFAERYGPWAVVAGASEGVGAAVARRLGADGINVVLLSRRQEALDEVAATVATETRTVALDLSDPDATQRLAEATAGLEVGLFVSVAGADPNASRFLDKPVETWQSLVTRNCLSVVGTVHHVAGPMVERGRGGIVLVSSGAAWAGGSHLAVYSATKAFDLRLAESLWAELRPHGVDVLSMVLGMTDTPAFRRILDGREMPGLADPDDVARDMLAHLADGPVFPPDGDPFAGRPRREVVETVSAGTTRLLGG